MEETTPTPSCAHDKLITLKHTKLKFREREGWDSTDVREYLFTRTVCALCGCILHERMDLVREQIYVHDIIE